MKSSLFKSFLSCMLLAGFIPLFGEVESQQASGPNFETQAKVLMQLKRKEYRTAKAIEEIKKQTADLPLSYRLALQTAFQIDPGIGLGLNLAIPSIGNWAIGNTAGGIVTTVIFLGGSGSIALGTYGIFMGRSIPYTVSLGMIGAGFGLLVIEGFLNLILPFAFADDMNKKLSQALGLTPGKNAHFKNNIGPNIGQILSATKPTEDKGVYFEIPLVSVRY